MNKMEYLDLIKKWHEKARDEDYFSKFVFEYLAFIAFLKTQLFESNDSDRIVIQKLKQDLEIKFKFIEKVNSNPLLKQDLQIIKQKLDTIPLGDNSRNLNGAAEEIIWWNCSYENTNQKTSQEKNMLSGVLHSIEDWENIIEFWYSVRNNLFHGAKNPENERDQFVVKYGYLTLKELTKVLLENEEIRN